MFCLLFRKFPYRISSDVLNILYSRCLFQCVVFNEQRRKHEVFMTCAPSGASFFVILFRMTVEIKGFEPLTPCLQGRCSPN